jgi:hypothetical protein
MTLQEFTEWLHFGDLPPVPVPAGYSGPVMLPGTGRVVYWTGRVAIGLRHNPLRIGAVSEDAQTLQDALRLRAVDRTESFIVRDWRRVDAIVAAVLGPIALALCFVDKP